MKKSDAIKVIADTIRGTPFEDEPTLQNAAKAILEALIAKGLTPPIRDYIEHYAFKTDRTWEKE